MIPQIDHGAGNSKGTPTRRVHKESSGTFLGVFFLLLLLFFVLKSAGYGIIQTPCAWPDFPAPLVIARGPQVTLGLSGCAYLLFSFSRFLLLPAGLGYISAPSIWGVFTGDAGALVKNSAGAVSPQARTSTRTPIHTPLNSTLGQIGWLYYY